MKTKIISIHIIFWLLYILSEYLANAFHIPEGKTVHFFKSIVLSLPILMISTYVIIGFGVPRLLQKKWWQFSVLLIVILFFVFYGRLKWLELLSYMENGRYFEIPPTKVLKNVIRDYSIIALVVCIHIITNWRFQQQQNEALLKAKTAVEIQLLKGQLQPHFLFNSLNNIYSLALMKSDDTAESILKLTELLDYLIYWANREKVALKKEVELLQNYFDLEQLRYDAKLKIDKSIAIQNENLQVSPLILLPFAENCFKHGGVGESGIFNIKMDLKVDDKQLYFFIENSKRQLASKKQVNGGIGLKNIQKRLELIYPKRFDLKIENEEIFYRVTLKIDFV